MSMSGLKHGSRGTVTNGFGTVLPVLISRHRIFALRARKMSHRMGASQTPHSPTPKPFIKNMAILNPRERQYPQTVSIFTEKPRKRGFLRPVSPRMAHKRCHFSGFVSFGGAKTRVWTDSREHGRIGHVRA